MKVADVAWGSDAFIGAHGFATPYPAAPELCIEIVSPSNSAEEIREKVALYLLRGAVEVWLCSDDGAMTFHDASGKLARSGLVPGFPARI